MDLGIEILSNLMYGYFEHIRSTDFTIGSLYCHNPDFQSRVIFKVVDSGNLDKKIVDIYNTYNTENHDYLNITYESDVQEIQGLNSFTKIHSTNNIATITITLTNQADLNAIAGLLRINGKWQFKKEILLPQ